MTKLNWRDASKELPENNEDVLIQYKFGSDLLFMVARYEKTIDKWICEVSTREDCNSESWFLDYILLDILKWVEIPIPEE